MASKTVGGESFRHCCPEMDSKSQPRRDNSPVPAKALLLCRPCSASQQEQLCPEPAFTLALCHPLHRESHSRPESNPEVPELKTQLPAMSHNSCWRQRSAGPAHSVRMLHTSAGFASRLQERGQELKNNITETILEVWKDFCVGNDYHAGE